MKKIFFDSESGFDGGAILEQMRNPAADFENIDSKKIAQAFDSASALAKRAFFQNESAAQDMVERFLHLLCHWNHFTVPSQGVPALVWGVFMRAKLKATFDQIGQHGPCDHQTMVRKLSEGVELNRFHPDFEALYSGNRKLDILFTKNFFHINSVFDANLITLLSKAPKGATESIIENVSDELINGTAHPDLKARWAATIGASLQNRVEDPDFFTESFASSNIRTYISNLNEPSYALGKFYVMEAMFPQISGRLYKMWSAAGYDDHALEHWLIHSTVDVGHAEEWMDAIKASELTDVQNGYVIDGANIIFAVRRKVFERILKAQ